MRINLLLVLALALAGCSTTPAHEDPKPAETPQPAPVPRNHLQKVMETFVSTADTQAFKDPCVQIDRSQGVPRGSVVLKDVKSKTHFLLVPTSPAPTIVTGIEDPKVLA